MLKMAVFAPIPSPSVRMATSAKPGAGDRANGLLEVLTQGREKRQPALLAKRLDAATGSGTHYVGCSDVVRHLQ